MDKSDGLREPSKLNSAPTLLRRWSSSLLEATTGSSVRFPDIRVSQRKGELAGQTQGISATLREVQEKTAFLPDYNFKPASKEESAGEKTPAWPGIEAGTSIAGIAGGAIVLVIIVLIGVALRTFKKQKE